MSSLRATDSDTRTGAIDPVTWALISGAAMPRVVARVGSILGLAFPVGVLIVACGLLFYRGSAAQYVAFGLAGVTGGVAWLGLPVWPLMLGRLVFNKQPIEREEYQ